MVGKTARISLGTLQPRVFHFCSQRLLDYLVEQSPCVIMHTELCPRCHVMPLVVADCRPTPPSIYRVALPRSSGADPGPGQSMQVQGQTSCIGLADPSDYHVARPYDTTIFRRHLL